MAIKVKSLSYSTVSQYSQCSERVWLEKVEHIKKHGGVSAKMMFGTAIHSALAAFYRAMIHKTVLPFDALLRTFRIKFESVSFPEDPDNPKELMLEQAKQLLEQFILLPKPYAIVSVEKPYRYHLTHQLEIVCQPDLVTRSEDGTITIVDWKSTSKRYADDQIRKVTEQCLTYAWAFHNEPMVKSAKALLFLRKKKPEIVDIELDINGIEHREMVQKFTMVQKALEHEIHFKNRSWMCNGCPYSYLCNEPAGVETEAEQAEERLAA